MRGSAAPGVRDAQQTSCVAHAERDGGDHVLHLGFQLQEAEVINDGRPVLADAAGDDLRLEVESVAKLAVGASPIDGVEILALKVLNKGELDHLLVVGLT